MSARRIRAIVQRLLHQFHRDRRTIALVFLAPIVIMSLLGYLIRGGGEHVRMGVVDQDQGPLGPMVTQRLLDSTTVDASEMDEATAESKLKSGDIAGYVVFPGEFSRNVQSTRTVSPRIHLEGTQASSNGAIVQAVQAALAAAAASAGPRLDVQVSFLYGGSKLDTLDQFGAAFIGLILFFLVFVITSIAFLRERAQGTLERLMASPLRRPEVVVGYMLGFTILALLQGAVVLVFGLYVIRIHNAGNVGLIFLLETLMAVAAVNLGIFLSMFARTEFQAVQFIPLVIVPQVLLSGILFPVNTEPVALQYISNVLPLTYAVYGLRDVMLKGSDLSSPALQLDALVVLAFAALMVIAATATLRRRLG
jgi:ABC-2 type transport system permease protein